MDILRCASPLRVIQEVPTAYHIVLCVIIILSSIIRSKCNLNFAFRYSSAGMYTTRHLHVYTCFKFPSRAYSSGATSDGTVRTSSAERCCRSTVRSNSRWRFPRRRRTPSTYWHRVSGRPLLKVPILLCSPSYNLANIIYCTVADKFLGDQRSSYNHDLTFKLSIGENSPDPTINDIILEGGAGLRVTQAIFGQGNTLPSDTVNVLSVVVF